MVEAEIETQLPPPEQHLAQTVVDRAISQKAISTGEHRRHPGDGRCG